MFRVFGPLAEELVQRGLGVLSEDRLWIGMHPGLADVYLTALAEYLAVANDMPAVTDQPSRYGVTNGWDVDTLARTLLADRMRMSISALVATWPRLWRSTRLWRSVQWFRVVWSTSAQIRWRGYARYWPHPRQRLVRRVLTNARVSP
jgi:hypothetical protein